MIREDPENITGECCYFCGEDEYCDWEDDSCGVSGSLGTCRSRAVLCNFAPTCACDGERYVDACEAAAAGADVNRNGCAEPGGCSAMDVMIHFEIPCACWPRYYWDGTDCSMICECSCSGSDCGRLFATEMECLTAFSGCLVPCGPTTGTVCASDSYCGYQDNSCGASAPGFCRPRPAGCGDHFAPTCGCDGRTYTNDCEALASGSAIWFMQSIPMETCPPPAGDCRTSGCTVPEICRPTPCPSGNEYLCLTPDAICA